MTLAEETAREEMASEVETVSEAEMTLAEETAREETTSEAEMVSEVTVLVATAREILSREETADLTLAALEVTEAEMTFSNRSYFL